MREAERKRIDLLASSRWNSASSTKRQNSDTNSTRIKPPFVEVIRARFIPLSTSISRARAASLLPLYTIGAMRCFESVAAVETQFGEEGQGGSVAIPSMPLGLDPEQPMIRSDAASARDAMGGTAVECMAEP